MKILILINDAPYGTEKAYNALRLANQLNKNHEAVEVRIYLTADAVSCAVSNQITPNGYYNIERMLKFSLNKGAKVRICESCADARGLKTSQLVEGTELSSISALTNWVIESDKIIVF